MPKDPKAVEPLIDALKDESFDVRFSATRALGKIKDPRAEEPLIDLLNDENKLVRHEAERALREIRGVNTHFIWHRI